TAELLALEPAGRPVFSRLLPPVDGQVEQLVAVVHRLDAAPRRPVSLEDFGAVSQVAKCASCPPGVQPRGFRASPPGPILALGRARSWLRQGGGGSDGGRLARGARQCSGRAFRRAARAVQRDISAP